MAIIKANQDSATFISNEYTQDAQDGDWEDNTPSIDYKLPTIVEADLASSSSTTLSLTSIISNNIPAKLYNPTDGIITGNLGIITNNQVSAVNINDILGDGSCYETLRMSNAGGDPINGNDISGDYLTFVDGKFGLCTSYDGTNTYQYFISNTPGSEFSISIWFNSDSIGTTQYLIDYNLSSASIAFTMGIKSSKLMTNFTDDSDSHELLGTTTLSSGVWYNFIATFKSNGNQTIYLNGNLESSSAVGVPADRGSNYGNYMGVDTLNANYRFSGLIDQIRFFRFKEITLQSELDLIAAEVINVKYADITSYGLTQAPTKAYKDTAITVSTVTEPTSGRCIAQDEVLTKVSSTTTEFVGTNTISGLLQTGDSIQVDGTTDVVTSSVVEANIVTVDIHDIFGDSSAIATYNLDGNSNDLGGNYDGTTTDVTYDTGKFGQAAVFNGSSSKIDIPETVNNNSSISLWCNIIGGDTSPNIYSTRTNDNGWQVTTSTSGDIINIQDRESLLSNKSWTSAFTISPNTWVHVVVTLTSNKFRVYIDNTEVGNADITGTYSSTSSAFGCQGQMDSYWYNGSIDQVRIFNRALTASEVNTLYTEQVTKYQYTCTLPTQATVPTSAKVLDRSTLATEVSDIYDSANNKFTKTYNKTNKQGRSFKYKINANTGIEVDQVNVAMNKQP